MSIFDLGQLQTVLELGLITSLTVLALFLSYTMLNVCDLSTDGCFTLGAAVGAIVALNGHPILSIPAAMLAGIVSGFVVAILQTVLGIDSLLAGIVVNTGLYSINIAVMKKSSLLNLNNSDTVFSLLKAKLDGTVLEAVGQTVDIAVDHAGLHPADHAVFQAILHGGGGSAHRQSGTQAKGSQSGSKNSDFHCKNLLFKETVQNLS